MYAYLGQETQSPEDAAGQAAYDEALEADWPPTKDNAKAVGAAAGGAAATAVCTAYGAAAAAPLCAAIGAKVGEVVGGVFYDLADSFFGTSDATRRNLDAIRRRATLQVELLKAGYRLCELEGRTDCGTYDEQALYGCAYSCAIGGSCSCGSGAAQFQVNTLYSKYNVPRGRGFTWDLQSDEQLTNMLRVVAAAESGRAAEIITKRELQSESWRALAKISEACNQDQACVDRTLADLGAICEQQGLVPGTQEYVDCISKQIPPPTSSSSAAPLLVGTAIAAGVAWWLLA